MFSIPRLIGLSGLILAASANADTVFRVGTGPQCTHATIQAAIDAAANDGNQPSLIRISNSLSYTNQALRISDRESLELRGGFAQCADVAPSQAYTRISGAGGTQQTVIAVVGNYPALVRLVALEITGGDAEDHEYGGGVYARHGGLLSIVASEIHHNRAGYGGGIAIEGVGTELALRNDVLVHDNGASAEGGGAYCRDGMVTVVAQNSGFLFNNAVTEGGGLRLNHCSADLASNGPWNAGTLYANTAYLGAGLSASDSVVRIYSNIANAPNRISGNRASSKGGGMIIRNRSQITLWDTLLEGNSASSGAAAFVYSNVAFDPRLRLRSARTRDAETPASAVACVSGLVCNRVTGNTARGSAVEAAEGAAFLYDWSSPSSCSFPFSCFWPRGFVADADVLDAQFDRNQGASLIYYRQHYNHYAIVQSLLFGNTVSDALIKTGDDDKVWLTHNTISHNNVLGALVRAPNVEFRCDLLNQTGVLHQGSGEQTGQYLLMPSTAQWPASTTVFQGAPRFLDVSRDNFRLYGGGSRSDPLPSIGTDMADQCGVFARAADQDGQTRPIDVAGVDQFGRIDVGAFEARPNVFIPF